MTTDLYDSTMEHHRNDSKQLELEHKVWDPTPWMIDVFLGGYGEVEYKDERNIYDWLSENIGEESWPIHDRPKQTWYRAGFTVMGWTWIGFGTKEQMESFEKAWPDNLKKKENK